MKINKTNNSATQKSISTSSPMPALSGSGERNDNFVHARAGSQTQNLPILATPIINSGKSPLVALSPIPPIRRNVIRNANPREITNIIGKPKNLVFLLDYDGTLMENTDPYTSTASESLKDSIQSLTSRPNVTVMIVSGRDHSYHIKAVPEGLGVHRIANHGADYLRAGDSEWENLVGSASLDWKSIAESEMDAFIKIHPGTQVEKKSRGVTLHCEQAADFSTADYQAGVLASQLKVRLSSYNLKIEHSAKVVEVRENSVDKGVASKTVIRKILGDTIFRDAVIVAAGDADTDEGMFKAFSDDPRAVTIRVGEGHSDARWRVPEPSDVREILRLVNNNLEES